MSTETGRNTGTSQRTYTRHTELGSTVTSTRFERPTRRARLRRGLRRTLRRARRRLLRLRRWLGETITATGWLILGAGVLGILGGVLLGWIEGWYLACVAVILVLCASPFLIGVRAYKMTISTDRDRVFAGSEVAVALNAENLANRPALASTAELTVGDAVVEVPVPLLGPRGERSIPLPLTAPNRGVIWLGPVTVSKRDPVGLFRREMTWRKRLRLWVHPRIVFLPQHTAGMVRDLDGQTSRILTDSDLSFHAVRDYARGDSYRHVHWRSTAKTGALMVRQYEESRLARVALVFDALRSEYVDTEEFELAVSVAASISVQAIRDGRERYVASAWHPEGSRAGVGELNELPSRTATMMLDAWAELEALTEGPSLEYLAHRVSHTRDQLSIVYLIVGSHTDPLRLRRAASLFPASVRVMVIRAERLADPRSVVSGETMVLTVGALGDLPQLLVRGSKG
ncbi:DUF58 domain-containing protein [Mycetocola saprophilus]|uniref:DUF58 domain-containing protein n=1 Tax=Mycetocola saprophilus TaxID=76636 RepID=UPI003BF0770D